MHTKHPRDRKQSSRRARVARGAMAASAAAASLLPVAAHAEEAAFGGGAFIGYHYGERSRLEWGLEAFGTGLFTGTGCSSDERMGAGAFLQLAWLDLQTPRITLGGHGGGEIERAVLALSGELGATYRFGAEGGFGIHTGAMAETFLLNVAARYQWLRNEAWVGGGVRVFSTYGLPSRCETVVGRPLRTDAGLLALHTQAHHAFAANNGQRIEAVGRAFERDAQLEHASIPAFLQLAAELSRAHAPRALVARTLGAARDEVRHAELCTRLATRHLEDCARPSLPAIAARVPIASQDSLVRLAVESWLDGCIAEGRAAAHAARAAELATDPEARAVQAAIASDEHRHAELAWSILSWSLERGGEETRAAVHALRDAPAGDAAAAHDELTQDGLEAHGRLGAAAVHTLAAAHFEASQRRLDGLLA